MEAAFGVDLSGVRMHDDHAAAASACDVGARAYTVGQHVVLPAGGRQPLTLLAHELAHVVQSGGRDPTGAIAVGARGTSAEREADVASRLAAAGMRVSVAPMLDHRATAVLWRAPDDLAGGPKAPIPASGPAGPQPSHEFIGETNRVCP